ncbi:MAG: DUF5686 and carboxypeptidase regulatory-like domain-containing protein [Bacteroidia bacterium]|nr:DUF5686 and carboxypeptidase regulatory-like domain-containing protein [Bacteroidia bacterium]
MSAPRRIFLINILLLLISASSLAQIRGQITDEKGAPLSTVNIYIEGTFLGTTTNDEGYYELNAETNKELTVVYKYLGFKTQKHRVTLGTTPYDLNIQLIEERYSLDEVVITSTEDPANRIIRQAIANRKEMLRKIRSYKAKFYSRGLIRIENAPEKILGQDIGDLGGGLDSTRSGIIYLSETISDISFEQPDNLYENILASKVSGDDSGFSFNTAIDVNFNFYNNTIELGNQIVSPIADYAFNYYRYKLEGVSYDENGNLINKIKVIPRRANDRIFEGTIYIIEDQWSIYALELNITGTQAQIPPAEVITLNQRFSYSESNAIWVLISQTIDFDYGIFGIEGDGRFTAVYSDYNFSPLFDSGTFSREILSFREEANKKDSTFWKTKRPVPLTVEEKTDYTKKDSIQEIRESKQYLDSLDAIGNAFSIGDLITGYNHQNSYKDRYWDIGGPFSKLSFNTVQGWKPGLVISYRKNYDEFRRYIQFNSQVDYGIDDKRIRARGRITYKFNNISRPFISISGGLTAQQFNATEPITPLINSVSTLFFEDNHMKLYERAFAELSYSEEWFNGLRFRTSASYERRKALFNNTDYVLINDKDDSYSSNNPTERNGFGIRPFDDHHIVMFRADATISFGQRYFSYPRSKFNIRNPDYPTIQLTYKGGFGSTVSNYNHSMVMGRLWQGFDIGNKGYFNYNFKAGTFFNADEIAFIDYKHFNGNQTAVGTTDSYLNVFNNLPYYAYSTNSSFMEFHAEHDFRGYILGKIPGINALNFNLILGAHVLSTEGINPYYEFSLGLDNIGINKFRFLRLDYVRSYQSGFLDDAWIFGLKFLDFID